MPKLDLGLPSYDSLFSTEEERQEASAEKVTIIPIDKITDFKEHPFHVTMDGDMAKLIDSIKENDMLMPALVRPKEDGTYEMISGHRRKFALSQLGRKEMNVIIRDLDDDQATILMVDSNIQRENIFPSERGYAYKMRLEAMKHQGKKVDIDTTDIPIEYDKPTSNQVGWKSESAAKLGEQIGISPYDDRLLLKHLDQTTCTLDLPRHTLAGLKFFSGKVAPDGRYYRDIYYYEHNDISFSYSGLTVKEKTAKINSDFSNQMKKELPDKDKKDAVDLVKQLSEDKNIRKKLLMKLLEIESGE